MLLNVGSGGGGAAAAPTAGGGGGGGGAAAAEEAPKEEEKEEGTCPDIKGHAVGYRALTDMIATCREGRVRRGYGIRSLRLSVRFTSTLFSCYKSSRHQHPRAWRRASRSISNALREQRPYCLYEISEPLQGYKWLSNEDYRDDRGCQNSRTPVRDELWPAKTHADLSEPTQHLDSLIHNVHDSPNSSFHLKRLQLRHHLKPIPMPIALASCRVFCGSACNFRKCLSVIFLSPVFNFQCSDQSLKSRFLSSTVHISDSPLHRQDFVLREVTKHALQCSQTPV